MSKQRKQTAETDAPEPTRTRRYSVRGPTVHDPATRQGMIDGDPVVFVQLSGKGYRREMILDAKLWPTVADKWGVTWVLTPTHGNYEYVSVVSGRSAVAPLAATKGPHPVAVLARLLTNASKGVVVCFENGDSLDLRMSNLCVMSKDEARHWAPGMRAFLENLTVTA